MKVEIVPCVGGIAAVWVRFHLCPEWGLIESFYQGFKTNVFKTQAHTRQLLHAAEKK